MLLGCVLAASALVAAGICLLTGAFAGLMWLWLLPLCFVGAFVVLAGLAFLFFWFMCSRVDINKPQENDSKFYRGMMHLYVDAVLTIARVKVKTSGLEQTPKSGRFLLVCNHTDNSDPIILLRVFARQQLAFISKRENKTMFVIGPMMHKLQCQLINRENDREALKTILKCIQILKEDKASVAVFPEGGINEDLLFHRFKPGVFKIAQKAKVPIVVCSLHNTKTVVTNLLKGKGSRVEMHLLEVIPVEEVLSATTVDIAHRCHQLIAHDLGPDQVAED